MDRLYTWKQSNHMSTLIRGTNVPHRKWVGDPTVERLPLPVRRLVRDFAQGAARAPQVVGVLTVLDGDEPEVWTVLDRDQGGTARDAIYDLELAVGKSTPDAIVGFRVLDLAHYPAAQIEDFLPKAAIWLFRRSTTRTDLSAG